MNTLVRTDRYISLGLRERLVLSFRERLFNQLNSGLRTCFKIRCEVKLGPAFICIDNEGCVRSSGTNGGDAFAITIGSQFHLEQGAAACFFRSLCHVDGRRQRDRECGNDGNGGRDAG